ncbi:MAG: cytochrome C oxidase subunit IV family protein [Acidobacteria bacterium]|nr:cytochrome C oxidase subunit IV family protein [Acidobacteriota bacterium]MBS1865551.1 cytochrome C oxidase subunit IV family protein [Acidobacteriota bacterium]
MTEAGDSSNSPGMRLYFAVWIGLLCIAGAEVFLSYRGFSAGRLLAVLLILAVVEAGIGLLYFMHLKYDRPILLWSFVLAVVFVLLMMNQIWPDAYRMVSIGHH